jgi:hypothetical protein
MTQPALALLKQAVNAAVESEGLRAFAERTGVPLGIVRGAQRDQNLTAASIAKLAEALGLEFHVGPAPLRPSPGEGSGGTGAAAGMAEDPAIFRMTAPGGDAWASLDRPAPAGAFFLQRDPDCGAAEGDRYCLVQPEAELLVGGLVYLEDREGRVAIGEFQGVNPANGWIRVQRHGAAMTDERAPGSLRRVAAVTWTGRTPPPAIMSGLAVAAEQLLAQRDMAKAEIAEILSELRERLMKAIE